MSNASQSLVAQWNELALEAIRAGSAKPTATTYQLHLNSAAVYDAWATFEPDAYGHYSEVSSSLGNTPENKAQAVSFAAFVSLVRLFPDQAQIFEDFLIDLGYDPADAVASKSTAAGVGTLAAENVFAARTDDGSNFENDFADTSGYTPVNSADPETGRAPGGADFNPNHWQPLRVPTGTVVDENGVPVIDNDDPASYVDQVALTPHWGDVTSFALASNDQFRPDAPPQLGDFSTYVDGKGVVTTNDQAYRDQVNEVLDVSAGLTTEQKVIAEFWADGPRTESPPGHWNQIAQDIALREGHGIDEDAKLFFALNAAIFDAGIATWEAKYTYDYIRPQSAIRDLYFDQTVEAWGGVNQGRQTILGQEWQPYQNVTFVTPPFPEYVSGHSTFSMAAARTIASFVGSDQYYDGSSFSNYDLDGVEGIDLLGQYVTSELTFEDFGEGPPVVLQWETLTEAALEAGASRIYGGIHIQDGNLNGLEVGRQVAANAEGRWEALFSRGGDDKIVADAKGGLIIAGAGDDRVFGKTGKDIVEAGSGDDVVMTARGNDTVFGEDGDDRIGTGRGDDYVDAGAGDDIVQGKRGSDTIFGNEGDDRLFGGRGNDFLDGGAGDDVAYGGRGNDMVIGGFGDDRLFGGRGDDSVYGDAGDDRIYGGRGNDVLMSGEGDDRIFAAQGNDMVVSGDGDDTSTGGAGADTFVFYEGEDGIDRITDFNGAKDTLMLVGYSLASTSFQREGADVVVQSENVEVAVLKNLGIDDLELGTNVIHVDTFII